MYIKNQKISDFFKNQFYRIRFWFYRNFNKNKLKYSSDIIKENYHLLFYDNFENISWGDKKENKKWQVGERWGLFHPEKPSVYYGPPNLTYDNKAVFTVNYNPKVFKTKTDSIIIPFEVSLLSSYFQHKYGRFECRCTLPSEKGVWPAFWLWGSSWPPEIDIFETYGGKKAKTNFIQKINLHYGNDNIGHKSMGAWGIKIGSRKTKDQYHEFACEWRRDKIEFFTDGIKIFTYSRKDVLNKWFNSNDANMRIIINNSIEEGIIDRNNSDFESKFYVDYIRAYY